MRRTLLALSFVCLILAAALPARATEFKWQDTAGQTHSLTEYHGKPVAIHLWASWCFPCRGELPELAGWLKAHPDVPMVLISVDGKAQDAEQFLQAKHIDIPVLLTDEAQAFNLGARGLPTTAIIDADGDVQQIWLGAQSWDAGFGDQLIGDLAAK